MVLTAKKDERALWESYCSETGRVDDLLVFGPAARFVSTSWAMSGTGKEKAPA